MYPVLSCGASQKFCMRSSNKGQQSSDLRGLKVSCRDRLLLARPLLALAGGETSQSNPQKPFRTRFGALVLGKVLAFTSYILCLVPFGGCSSGPSNPPVSVPLPAPEIKEAANCAKERGDHGANIYKCPSELGPIFVTTVKDCSIPEKFTFQATTRQLLVGVMDLTVMSHIKTTASPTSSSGGELLMGSPRLTIPPNSPR